jgi:hypothetical protein
MMSANPEIREVRKDMLSLTSTVQEILRALYFYGADYIMVSIGKKERLLHKDQLIALLEQGRESATIEDMLSLALAEPISAKTGIEDVPPGLALIIFSDDGLYGTTFEIYREMKIREAMIVLPDWWGVPLPLLHLKDGRISLNDAALRLIPGGTRTIAGQIEKIQSEKLITIKDKKSEKTFSLLPLDLDTFLIEDVSGDFEMVEDLVWWAAIGSAFVRRMEGNGLTVRRVSPHGQVPQDAAEIIPCHWEGEMVGSFAIELPKESGPESANPPSQDDAPPPGGKAGKAADKKGGAEKDEKAGKAGKNDKEAEAKDAGGNADKADKAPEIDTAKNESGNGAVKAASPVAAKRTRRKAPRKADL